MSSVGSLKYMGIEMVYNCGQKILNNMEASKKGKYRWGVISTAVVHLPSWKRGWWLEILGWGPVGSLDTGMGS